MNHGSTTTSGEGEPVDADPRALALTRELWAHLEVVHTVVYFAPAVHDAHERLGFDGPMQGYVAARCAPMGAVGPEVATAALFGFAPSLVTAAVPAAWERAHPAAVLDATLDAVDRTLGPLLTDLEDEVVRAAELARQAAELHPIVGRPLAAGRRSLAWPAPAHLMLYEAATRIRESRGDGHNAALVSEGLDGCGCHLTVAGDGEKLRRYLTARRGWSVPELDAALRRLQGRDILADDGSLAPAGQQLRRRLEERTDALASPPWEALGRDASEQLLASLRTIVVPIVRAGILPSAVTRRVA